MKSSLLMLSLIVIGSVVLLQVTPLYATPITYNLVNYPTEQNGWTLSGSITTDGTIGVIQTDRLVAATWTITKGAETYTSVADLGICLLENVVASATDLRLGVNIGGGSSVALQSNANLTMLYWFMDYSCNTPGWGTAWADYDPAAFVQNNFIIASNVPEPSSLVLLGIGAVSLLGYAWRRHALHA